MHSTTAPPTFMQKNCTKLCQNQKSKLKIKLSLSSEQSCQNAVSLEGCRRNPVTVTSNFHYYNYYHYYLARTRTSSDYWAWFPNSNYTSIIFKSRNICYIRERCTSEKAENLSFGLYMSKMCLIFGRIFNSFSSNLSMQMNHMFPPTQQIKFSINAYLNTVVLPINVHALYILISFVVILCYNTFCIRRVTVCQSSKIKHCTAQCNHIICWIIWLFGVLAIVYDCRAICCQWCGGYLTTFYIE